MEYEFDELVKNERNQLLKHGNKKLLSCLLHIISSNHLQIQNYFTKHAKHIVRKKHDKLFMVFEQSQQTQSTHISTPNKQRSSH
jgi:hypothetical protein